MKKLIAFLLFVTLAFSTKRVMASTNVSKATYALSYQSDKMMSKEKAMVKRVNEIRSMDKKNLSAKQRQDLKNELLGMKKQLSEPMGFGIYISGSALLLIIILLILFL